MLKNFLLRFDFKFHSITFLPFIVLILSYPAIKFLPVKYAYENGPIENLQLIVLLSAFILCLKVKKNKNFFNSLAFVVVILFLREINCGRTIFFPIEGLENAFYSWKDIPYGYFAHPLYALFMVVSGFYFIFSKAYKTLFNYAKNAFISVYNWLFLILGIVFGTLGEKIHNFTLEEMAELLFYLSFTALIYLQGFNNNYIEKA